MIVEKLLGLARQVADQFGLLARFHVQVFHMLQSLLPIVSETQFARRLQHLAVAPGELFIRDRDEFFRRIRHHLIRQFIEQHLAADRIAHHLIFGRAQNFFVFLQRLVQVFVRLRNPPRE